MKYPKTFFAFAVLAIFSLTLAATAQAHDTTQDSGSSVLETPVETPSVAPVAVAQVSNLENPLVAVPVVQVAYPVIYYQSPTPVQRYFTRSVTVPVVNTLSSGQILSAGYSTATVRAAIFPRLKARRLANGVQAQAVSTTTVLVQ